MLRTALGAFKSGSRLTIVRSVLPRRGLEEFFDRTTPRGEDPITGRPWTVVELRQKCFDDLHKLWWILYKEKNMLLTEKVHVKRKGRDIRCPDRLSKVNKSMKAVRHVVDERSKFKRNLEAEKLKKEKEAKFNAVRAAALERGDAPKNASDVIARRKIEMMSTSPYPQLET